MTFNVKKPKSKTQTSWAKATKTTKSSAKSGETIKTKNINNILTNNNSIVVFVSLSFTCRVCFDYFSSTFLTFQTCYHLLLLLSHLLLLLLLVCFFFCSFFSLLAAAIRVATSPFPFTSVSFPFPFLFPLSLLGALPRVLF